VCVCVYVHVVEKEIDRLIGRPIEGEEGEKRVEESVSVQKENTVMNEMTFVKLLFISIHVFDGVHLVKLSLPGYSWLFKVRPLLPHFLKTIVSINFFPWSMSAAGCEGQGRGRVKVGEKARGHILLCTAACCATTYTSNLLQIQDVWLDGKVKLFSQAFAPIKLRTCEIGVISN